MTPQYIDVTPVTMPGRPRQVNFASQEEFSRLPYDDEKYVMEAFAHHASHCTSCASPYSVYRSGGTLCETGHALAIDVAQYVYNHASQPGRAFSMTDRNAGHYGVQVEIPAGCGPVRGLLAAMNEGLRLRRAQKPQSMDRTYEVKPRVPHLEERAPKGRKVEKQATYRVKSVGKGSLYEEDMKERARRAKKSVYYEVAERAPRRG